MTKSRIVLALIKSVALIAGGLLTVISLMALMSLIVENGWAQLGLALLIALVVPALVADRMLPPDTKKSNGVVTDVYSLLWLGFALAFLALSSFTGDLLRDKAAEFHAGGKDSLASLTMWVAGPGEAEAATTQPIAAEPTVVTSVAADAGPALVEEKDAAALAATTADAGGKSTETEESTSKIFTPAELFKEMAPAVVTITTQSGPMGMGGGTGFIVDDNGIVVTNHHVIDGAKSVTVKLIGGRWASKVELLVQDKEHDLAILKITVGEELKTAKLGDSDEVQVGERAISIGNPLGLEHTLTDGLVSARRTYEGKKMIQMSTPVSPGNSGGPLFNLKGEVIGVSTAQLGSYRRGQNLNLAIPINQAKGMITGDYPDRKRVGGGSPAGKGTW